MPPKCACRGGSVHGVRPLGPECARSVLRVSWTILDYLTPFSFINQIWPTGIISSKTICHHIRQYSTIFYHLRPSLPTWDHLRYFRPFGTISRHPGPYQTICSPCATTSDPLGPSWSICDYLGPSQPIWDYVTPTQIISAHLHIYIKLCQTIWPDNQTTYT